MPPRPMIHYDRRDTSDQPRLLRSTSRLAKTTCQPSLADKREEKHSPPSSSRPRRALPTPHYTDHLAPWPQEVSPLAVASGPMWYDGTRGEPGIITSTSPLREPVFRDIAARTAAMCPLKATTVLTCSSAAESGLQEHELVRGQAISFSATSQGVEPPLRCRCDHIHVDDSPISIRNFL